MNLPVRDQATHEDQFDQLYYKNANNFVCLRWITLLVGGCKTERGLDDQIIQTKSLDSMTADSIFSSLGR